MSSAGTLNKVAESQKGIGFNVWGTERAWEVGKAWETMVDWDMSFSPFIFSQVW